MSIKNRTNHTKHNELKLINDFYIGKLDVRTHLLKWTKEDAIKYNWRLTATYYQNYIKPIVNGITNIIMRKPITSNIIDEFERDVNLMGFNIDRFIADICNTAVKDGLCIIVSKTNSVDQVLSKQDELNYGIRAYMQKYTYDDIISYKYDEGKLSQLVLFDSISKDKDEFTSESYDRYTVYNINQGRIFECKKGGTPELVDSWDNDLGYIPIEIIYGTLDANGLNADSVISDITYLNKAHYNLKSGIMNICHIASNPVPIMYGRPYNADKTMSIGVNSVISFPQKSELGFEWVEVSGSSVTIAENEIGKLEDYIIENSFNILKVENFTTATEARINDTKNKSMLTSTVNSIESGINKSLITCSKLAGYTIGDIIMDYDFSDLQLTGDKISSLVALRKDGNISLETLWSSLVKGEVVEIDDIELEKDRLLAEIDIGL